MNMNKRQQRKASKETPPSLRNDDVESSPAKLSISMEQMKIDASSDTSYEIITISNNDDDDNYNYLTPVKKGRGNDDSFSTPSTVASSSPPHSQSSSLSSTPSKQKQKTKKRSRLRFWKKNGSNSKKLPPRPSSSVPRSSSPLPKQRLFKEETNSTTQSPLTTNKNISPIKGELDEATITSSLSGTLEDDSLKETQQTKTSPPKHTKKQKEICLTFLRHLGEKHKQSSDGTNDSSTSRSTSLLEVLGEDYDSDEESCFQSPADISVRSHHSESFQNMRIPSRLLRRVNRVSSRRLAASSSSSSKNPKFCNSMEEVIPDLFFCFDDTFKKEYEHYDNDDYSNILVDDETLSTLRSSISKSTLQSSSAHWSLTLSKLDDREQSIVRRSREYLKNKDASFDDDDDDDDDDDNDDDDDDDDDDDNNDDESNHVVMLVKTKGQLK